MGQSLMQSPLAFVGFSCFRSFPIPLTAMLMSSHRGRVGSSWGMGHLAANPSSVNCSFVLKADWNCRFSSSAFSASPSFYQLELLLPVDISCQARRKATTRLHCIFCSGPVLPACPLPTNRLHALRNGCLNGQSPVYIIEAMKNKQTAHFELQKTRKQSKR